MEDVTKEVTKRIMAQVTKEVSNKVSKIRESLPLPEEVPTRMWLAAAMAVALGALSIGVFKLLKPRTHPSPGSITQVTGLNPSRPTS